MTNTARRRNEPSPLGNTVPVTSLKGIAKKVEETMREQESSEEDWKQDPYMRKDALSKFNNLFLDQMTKQRIKGRRGNSVVPSVKVSIF